MKKKSLIRILVAAIACLVVGGTVLAGCVKKKTVTIEISGSSSVSPVMEKLAAEFEKLHKEYEVKIATSDSGGGVKDAQEGTSDIGMVSRELKSSETGLTATQICYDALAIIVSKDSDLNNVTNSQLWGLYVENTPVGSVNTAISRENGSGTRDFFNEKVMNPSGGNLKDYLDPSKGGSQYSAAVVSVLSSTSAVREEVAVTNGRIGYISFGSIGSNVKALRYDGVELTIANAKSGSYDLVRPFNIVTKEGAEIKSEVQEFIDFILSADGQKIIEKAGCIAL